MLPHIQSTSNPARNPFARYPPNSSLYGCLVFYVKTDRQAGVPHGIRRGPIYRKGDMYLCGKAEIFSTASSSIGLGEGEGLIEDVEIKVVGQDGVFVIKLRGKERYIVESCGKLYVSKTTTRDQATRFMLEMKEGRVVPKTALHGLQWYDQGEGGWNTERCGDELFLQFVSEEERKERRGRNPWGTWQPEYDILWL